MGRSDIPTRLRELERENRRVAGEIRRREQDVATAAHDLKSPIGTIRSYCESIRDGLFGEVPPDLREAIETIAVTAAEAEELLEDVLTLGRIETGGIGTHPEETDPAAFARGCAADFEGLAAAKSVPLAVETGGDLPPFRTDPRLLRQALGNLLSNGIKFSPPGAPVLLEVARDGEGIAFTVADRGPGIPEGERDRLFRKFGRTSVRPTGGETGTGLGLAIVKHLTEILGGSVNVETAAGHGSRFRIRLPPSPGLRPAGEAD